MTKPPMVSRGGFPANRRGAALRAQLLAAAQTTGIQDLAARLGCHARAKTVPPLADQVGGLEGALRHRISPVRPHGFGAECSEARSLRGSGMQVNGVGAEKADAWSRCFADEIDVDHCLAFGRLKDQGQRRLGRSSSSGRQSDDVDQTKAGRPPARSLEASVSCLPTVGLSVPDRRSTF